MRHGRPSEILNPLRIKRYDIVSVQLTVPNWLHRVSLRIYVDSMNHYARAGSRAVARTMHVRASCDRVDGMSRHGCVRFQAFATAILLILAVSHCAIAESLFINIEATGRLDAKFHSLKISASIVGDVGLVGNISYGESTVWFSAKGRAYGTGSRDILVLTSKGWIVLHATGQTADGETIVIRMLLYALRQSLIPLKADDLFEGVHHTVIQTNESINVYEGEFAGTLTGGLAPADIEGTIRLSGRASFNLIGEWIPEALSDDYPGSIPLDDPDLSEDFLQTIDEFFNSSLTQESQDI